MISKCPPPFTGEVAAKLTEGALAWLSFHNTPSTLLRRVPLPRTRGRRATRPQQRVIPDGEADPGSCAAHAQRGSLSPTGMT